MDALACTSSYFTCNENSCISQYDDSMDCDQHSHDTEIANADKSNVSAVEKHEQSSKRRGRRKHSKCSCTSKFKMRKDSKESMSCRSSETLETEYTPLQQQFLDLKNKHPDVILLIETGYLYRFFGEDAEVAAKELQFKTNFRHNMLTTSIPYQTLHIHIGRLVAKGYKVGVVRKTETALMKSTGKDQHSIFRRELVALYTKSTLVGEEIDPLSSNYDNNQQLKSQINSCTYLMCLYEVPGSDVRQRVRIGIVAVCPLSGDIIYDCIDDDDQRQVLQSVLAHIKPVEILLPEMFLSDETTKTIAVTAHGGAFGEEIRIEKMADENFLFNKAKLDLQEFYDSWNTTNDNSGNLMTFVMQFPPPVICCLGAILNYLKTFQLETLLTLIKNGKQFSPRLDCMYLDTSTMKSLGLFHSCSSGQESGGLFALIDKTSTSFGSRLLRTWLSRPLIDNARIIQRLDVVRVIKERSPTIISSLREILLQMPDLESGITSIFYKKCSTKKYWKTIVSLKRIKMFIKSEEGSIGTQVKSQYLRTLLRSVHDNLDGVESLCSNLDREAAWNGYKNRIFKRLDEYPKLIQIHHEILDTRQKLEALLPKIANCLGRKKLQYSQFAEKEYVIVVKPSCAYLIPADWIIVAQTNMKICCRTREMDALAKKMKLIKEHFKYESHLAWLEYLDKFKPYCQKFRQAIGNLAKIDCLIALATLAKSDNYEMPELYTNSEAFIDITCGRNPVTNSLLEQDKQYIPNDTCLTRSRTSCMIITGANMAGKSTYARGVALIVILCQIGSFVPAASAIIKPLSAIYARSGVWDNIMQGKSSFSVEAGRVAEIFTYMPNSTLILLDEFGRCTSNTDGIALAYGLVKHLVNKTECISIVVTQFPELTKLSEEFGGNKVRNFHMSILTNNPDSRDDDDSEITYMYTLNEGVCERGYPQKVCIMAGIEESILEIAAEKSREMEVTNRKSRLAVMQFQKLFNEVGYDQVKRVREMNGQQFL